MNLENFKQIVEHIFKINWKKRVSMIDVLISIKIKFFLRLIFEYSISGQDYETQYQTTLGWRSASGLLVFTEPRDNFTPISGNTMSGGEYKQSSSFPSLPTLPPTLPPPHSVETFLRLTGYSVTI